MGIAKLDTLLDAVQRDPQATAIICAGGGPHITRGQLLELAIQFGATLRASGIKPGDTVNVADVNTVEFVVAFIGTTLARAVAAPLNSNYKKEEFRFFMDDAGSKLLVLPARGNAAAEAAAAELGTPTATLSVARSGGAFGFTLEPKAGGTRISRPQGKPSLEPPRPEDVALFLHTSGTTSRPKGVPLTHKNLASSLANIAATYELGPADRSLLVMPLFHVHGLMAGMLAPLAAGSAVILPAEGRFSAGTFWRDASAHGATFFTAVPTMHQILLARAEKDYPRQDPPPLRFIRSCSSSLAAPTLHKLEAAFNVPVLEAYAMTEASHQMTSNPLPKHGPHKPGTVGTAQGSVQVTVLDGDSKPVPQGKIGEVCLQGPNVTKGYLNRPEANEEAFAGGWFHTGDQGFLDEDGFLTLTGRIKELINRGGEKISPLEVDSALLAHPAVTEAVSFGAPDEKYGEVVAAAVVLAKPSDDREALVKDIQRVTGEKLAAFKVPTRIFITEALPKGPTGKVQRRFMVDAFINKKQERGGKGGVQKNATAGGGAAAASPSGQGEPLLPGPPRSRL